MKTATILYWEESDYDYYYKRNVAVFFSEDAAKDKCALLNEAIQLYESSLRSVNDSHYKSINTVMKKLYSTKKDVERDCLNRQVKEETELFLQIKKELLDEFFNFIDVPNEWVADDFTKGSFGWENIPVIETDKGNIND